VPDKALQRCAESERQEVQHHCRSSRGESQGQASLENHYISEGSATFESEKMSREELEETRA